MIKPEAGPRIWSRSFLSLRSIEFFEVIVRMKDEKLLGKEEPKGRTLESKDKALDREKKKDKRYKAGFTMESFRPFVEDFENFLMLNGQCY